MEFHSTQTHAIFTKYQFLKNEQSTVIMYSMQFHMQIILELRKMILYVQSWCEAHLAQWQVLSSTQL